MTVVTRFAPSPTGYLHIGGARTALFNWLYARHHGGVFRLRIEDTDRARSTVDAVRAILDGLRWLELDWDGEIVHQHAQAERHRAVALRLLDEGKAYRCYCTPEELEAMREAARREGRPVRYDGRWRDRDPAEAPPGIDPVIRLRAPQAGETVVEDRVQGRVVVQNAQLDDMILLRGDGSPTYMLSVVVDDIDMGITHVVRGDDHLTNAFRQTQLYAAIGAPVPIFAHVPLIHGPDGAKLSKRHGALGVEAYRDMGLLPAAMRNYLLRLGWGHGDDEIIPTEKAVEWFDLDGIGRAPSRLDFAKMEHLNGVYMREAEDSDLLNRIEPQLTDALGGVLSATGRDRILRGMNGLKQRAKTLVELSEAAVFYARIRPIPLNEAAAKLLTPEAREMLGALRHRLAALEGWTEAGLESEAGAFAAEAGLKLGRVAQPLRAALTGSNVSPGIFEVAFILGRDETLGRIADVVAPAHGSGGAR